MCVDKLDHDPDFLWLLLDLSLQKQSRFYLSNVIGINKHVAKGCAELNSSLNVTVVKSKSTTRGLIIP